MKLVLIWIQVARNKSQIPWELVELSPTQRSEMDGSHYVAITVYKANCQYVKVWYEQ